MTAGTGTGTDTGTGSDSATGHGETHGTVPRPKVALLINIIGPYRLPVYTALAAAFDLTILTGGREANRTTWQGLEQQVSGARVRRSWGLTLPYPGRRGGRVFSPRYLHLTPGYLIDLLRIRPRAVISNEMGLRSIIALTYGALFRVPVWIWWGGTLHTEAGIGRSRQLTRAVFRRVVRHWISYGSSSTDYLLSLDIPRGRIVQIQNAVDERLFQAPHPATLDLAPRPALLVVGALIRRKGLEELLRAAAEVQRAGHRFSLTLVGDGPERPVLEALIAELGLQHVTLHGSVTPSAMAGIYRSADVLVFPTLEDVWGLVVNEALWSGLPVLCSRWAGCAGEIVPSANVFDPLDHTAFVSALTRAVTGDLAPADTTPMRSTEEVAGRIIDAIHADIGTPDTRRT